MASRVRDRASAFGAALLLVLCTAAADAPPVATLTSARARSLAGPTLAREVLGLAGTTMRESRVIASGPPLASTDQLAAVQFARAPEAAGDGICQAQVVSVTFVPLASRSRDADPEARATGIMTGSLWAALPDGTGLPADPYARLQAEAARCAALSPILTPGAGFFPAHQGTRELDAREVRAISALLGTLGSRAPSLGGRLTCGDAVVQGCPNAGVALRRLDLRRPFDVTVEPCASGAVRLCIRLQYERVGLESVAGNYTEVLVSTDGGALTDPIEIRSVQLQRMSWVV